MIPRRILVSAILIFTIYSAAGSLPGRAQNRQPGAFYTQPAKVGLDGLIRRRFSEYYIKRDYGWETLITEGFYPIGWSKDGKFAYYSEPGDEACDCYFAKLIILDLVSDKVLWSFDYDSGNAEGEGRKNPPTTITTLWKEKRKLFSDKLREHNIVPQRPFSLLLFPIKQAGDQLTTELKIKENKDEETRLYGIVNQATLQLISRRNGKKTILDKTYDTETDPSPLDLKVLGYTKSPFEPRIAVVMIEIHRGYEGPPHTTHIKIVGSSLSSGFK
jgi:hypothetical protein